MGTLRAAFDDVMVDRGCHASTVYAGKYPHAFLKVMEPVIKEEQGFTPTNGDGAGATLYGITEKHHPELAKKIRSRTLTMEEALAVYYQDYWLQLKGIDRLSPGLQYYVFDSHIQGCVFCAAGALMMAAGLQPQTKISGAVISALASIPRGAVPGILYAIKMDASTIGSRIAQGIMRRERKRNRVAKDLTVQMIARVRHRVENAMKIERGEKCVS